MIPASFNSDERRLPEWFEAPCPPGRDSQLALFNTPFGKWLDKEHVSVEEVRQWRRKGWISYDINLDECVDEVNDSRILEVEFIRDLVRSGLAESQIDCLLTLLPRPYAYDPSRIALSFRYGWVTVTPHEKPEPSEIVAEHLDSWLDEQDNSTLRELIVSILDRIGS